LAEHGWQLRDIRRDPLASFSVSTNRENNSRGLIVTLLLVILAPIAAALVQFGTAHRGAS